MAEAIRAEKKAFRVARGAPDASAPRYCEAHRDRYRRRRSGKLGAVCSKGLPGDRGRLPRSAPKQLIDEICIDLHGLYTEILEVLETFTKTQNMGRQ